MAPSAGDDDASGSAATKPEPAADCPSLTLVLLESGACVDRIAEFAVATSPTSIVTGADGQVWFDDDGSNQLVQLDSEGRVLKRVDCDAGSSPRALAGGRNDVLVWYTDTSAKILNRLTQTGLTPLEIKVTPAAVVLGEGDELWITEADQALYRVRPYVSVDPYAVTPTRALVMGSDHNVWFPSGSVMGRLTPEQGVKYFSLGASFADELCTGPDGALWFSDSAQHRIGRLELDGDVQTVDLPPGSTPTRIVAGPDDAVWFVEEGGDKIGRVGVDGELTQYPIPTSGGLPYALTVGGDGKIWFTEKFSGKIGRLIPDPRE
jgi:virginiamycin B lyase